MGPTAGGVEPGAPGGERIGVPFGPITGCWEPGAPEGPMTGVPLGPIVRGCEPGVAGKPLGANGDSAVGGGPDCALARSPPVGVKAIGAIGLPRAFGAL